MIPNQTKRKTRKIRKTKKYIIPTKASIYINSNAIRHNIKYFRDTARTDIMPILKANAYGHGAIELAAFLRKEGIIYIGVATLAEAISLRRSGDRGRILAWLYDIHSPEIREAITLNIDIALFDATLLDQFITHIPPHTIPNITVFVDTGINRAGVPYNDALEFCRIIHNHSRMKLVGIMSHLICSEIKNSPIVHNQLRQFRTLLSTLRSEGINPPLRHIANTSACINYDVSDFTISRIGIGLFGIELSGTSHNKLKQTTSLTASIIQIKKIKKGEGIGYNWTFIAPRTMLIGIVPIGYADSIIINAKKLYVYIKGKKRRILGTPSMDQIVIELQKGDHIGNTVYLFGECPQTIYDISKISNLKPSEILSNMGHRLDRMIL